MSRLLIVKTGDSYPDIARDHGDFETLFQQVLAGSPTAPSVRVFDATRATALPRLDDVDGLLITGSHAMVSHAEPWSEALKPWLVEARDRNIAMLGVCYGHQLMASAFGGASDFHPAGRESGTREVTLTEAGQQDPLLGSLPGTFRAHLSHAQTVIRAPAGACVLATNGHDPHQALRHGPRQWSVQFHPEFTEAVMRAYLGHQRDALRDQGEAAERLIADVGGTPEATGLLTRFALLAASQQAVASLS
ncbi:GMP synthase (glutamine-hydrolyzing) [Halomonas fontilapidosi]|uniref:GMP synthase (Glutamine-hydrolyzing) n=1 Tax=Halomonas fontilapidosi TaxID=616675 RepID=A0A7W5DJN7_9GAMM|nr:glutamine amidotransferase [Halomonas fontilapidosi]MBB3184182.1 GMP synthase (glutamine-hydrolyzing) [Halomonas fontilapidosi]